MTRWLKILVGIVVVGGLLVACGDGTANRSDSPPSTNDIIPDTPPETSAPDTSAPDTDASPSIMAAAIRHLVSEDHTFGDGPPPFTEYLMQERYDPVAGNPTGGAGGELRLLADDERAAIAAALEDFGPVRWIADPDEWRTDDLMPAIAGAVILGVGEPAIDGDIALVPMSLWCGGTCGTWLTYRVELIDGAWEVTGTDGPIAVS